MTLKIIRYQLRDVFRSRWVILYTLFFLLTTDALFRFGGEGERVILSLMNIIIIIVPLISLVLGAMYMYQSREYLELMLTQPIKRGVLFNGIYIGLTLPLSVSYAIGLTVPFMYHGAIGTNTGGLIYIILIGVLLTFVFTSLAYLIALKNEDKIKGLGLSLVVWLFFTVIYDGLILLVIFLFSEYPLQKTVLALSMLNPVDLGRILMLLQFDISAIMGFTGAVFQRFFGSTAGQFLGILALTFWLLIPYTIGFRTFKQKNF
jgi:Cu-processing system permease protein